MLGSLAWQLHPLPREHLWPGAEQGEARAPGASTAEAQACLDGLHSREMAPEPRPPRAVLAEEVLQVLSSVTCPRQGLCAFSCASGLLWPPQAARLFPVDVLIGKQPK